MRKMFAHCTFLYAKPSAEREGDPADLWTRRLRRWHLVVVLHYAVSSDPERPLGAVQARAVDLIEPDFGGFARPCRSKICALVRSDHDLHPIPSCGQILECRPERGYL